MHRATLRAVRSWEEAIPQRASDEGVLEAMLLSVGDRGYDKATVQEVAGAQRHLPRPLPAPLRRQGGLLRARPTRMAAERLCAEVLEAGREAAELAGGLPRRPGRAAAHRRRAAAAGEGAADRGARRPRRRPGPSTSSWSSASSRRSTRARHEPGARPTATPITAQLRRRRDRGIDRARDRRRPRGDGRAPASRPRPPRRAQLLRRGRGLAGRLRAR